MAAFRSSGRPCICRSCTDCSLFVSKLAGALLTRSSVKWVTSSSTVKCLGPVVERPAQEGQIVDDRFRQVTHLTVEIDDDRVELLGLGFQADFRGDGESVFDQLREVFVLQVFGEFTLAEFHLAARLRDAREMGVLGQFVAERLGDEDLPRGVGEVLLGADDVGYLHRVVVNDAGQMVEARPVGALDDVVLLLGPIELDISANEVGDD